MLLSFFFVNFVFFGAVVILVGAAVPEILRTYSWRYVEMGAILAGGSIGYFVSTFVCGILLRRWGPKRVIVYGLVLQAAGLAAFGQMPSLAINAIALLLIGLGQGGSEVVTNFSIVRIEHSGRSNLMNFIHAAFTTGAIVGPLGIGQLIERGYPWQVAFLALAFLSLLMALAFTLLSFETVSADPAKRENSPLSYLMSQPLMLLLTTLILLYVGVEIGTSNWIAEYFVQSLGVSAASGAYTVSLFWMGLLAGRLSVAIFYRRDDQAVLLVTACILSALSLSLGLWGDSFIWKAACFFSTGMGFSIVYPVVVVLAGRFFPNQQEMAIAVISTGGGVGSFAFPFAMSSLADSWGIGRAFWFYAFIALAMSGVAVSTLFVIRSLSAKGDGKD
ncbi:MAG: MFS transporter [Candidatus Latescibacterota bacterium]|nr:MFS transporter [Candidatus Latescibacterota bacterium]MEE2628319.1 MFS transporter [Candidatus Latescibacterota bacterium]